MNTCILSINFTYRVWLFELCSTQILKFSLFTITWHTSQWINIYPARHSIHSSFKCLHPLKLAQLLLMFLLFTVAEICRSFALILACVLWEWELVCAHTDFFYCFHLVSRLLWVWTFIIFKRKGAGIDSGIKT